MKFYVLTDTHLYSKRNWKGDPYKAKRAADQLQLRESSDIIKEAFEYIKKDKEVDVVLITGDITNNGEKSSHEDLIALLSDLKASGKRVYVTTSTHDFCYDWQTSYGYDENGKYTEDIEIVRRDELFEMYKPFGISDAISYHMPDMSYVIQLDDRHRVLMLNDDENIDPATNKIACGYTPRQMEWIKEQIADARKEGIKLFATTHHPVLPPAEIYAFLSEENMLERYKEMRDFFADNDIAFIFTGHTHMHKIAYYKSLLGKPLYDIATGATPGCPVSFRRVDMDLDKGIVDIKSIQIRDLPGHDLNGKSLPEFCLDDFRKMLNDIILSMGTDKDRFAAHARGFSIHRRDVYAYWPFIKPAGKWLNKFTLQKAYNYTKKETGLKLDDIQDIKDKRFVDSIFDSLEKLYIGDADISPDSAEYKIVTAMFAVIDSFLATLGKQTKLQEYIAEIMWNHSMPDNDVVIDLSVEPKIEQYKLVESNKGMGILIGIILMFFCCSCITVPFVIISLLVIGYRKHKYKDLDEGPHKPDAIE